MKMKSILRVITLLAVYVQWEFKVEAFQPSGVAHLLSVQTFSANARSAFSTNFFLGRSQRTLNNNGATTGQLRSTMDSASKTQEFSSTERKFDFDAVVKYGTALATQMALFFGIFTALDKLTATSFLGGGVVKVPFAMNVLFFYLVALKSRVLNPLANNRPQPRTLETVETSSLSSSQPRKRIMPTWTPPGFIFPIVWLLIIGPIRAVTSARVYQATGSYAHPAILSLMLHLSIGDIWNTINNVERRYGVSVVGVLCVWASKAVAAYQYYRVDAVAGKLLSLTLIWLSIASALVTRTWQLNPDETTGKPEPIYPVIISGKPKSQFAWFVKRESDLAIEKSE
jgi:translocator protein